MPLEPDMRKKLCPIMTTAPAVGLEAMGPNIVLCYGSDCAQWQESFVYDDLPRGDCGRKYSQYVND